MKKNILIGLMLLSGVVAVAQSNYKEGYVITLQGDTLWGWADYRTDKMNAKICNFKKSETDKEPTSYEPGQIAGYRFSKEGKYYITRNIEINNVQQTVFVEFLVQGLLNLYYYTDELNYYIFEDRETGKMTYTTQKPDEIIYKEGTAYNQKDVRYRNILTYTFKNYEPIKKEVQKLDFTYQSMVNLAKNYHNLVCTTGEKCIEFEGKEDKHYVNFDFFASAGLEYQLFVVEESFILESRPAYRTLTIKEKPQHFEPLIRVGVAFSIPRKMKSMSAQLSLYATKIEHSFQKDNLDHTISTVDNMGVITRTYLNDWDYNYQAYKVGNNLSIKYTYHKGWIRPSLEVGTDLVSFVFNEECFSNKKYVNTDTGNSYYRQPNNKITTYEGVFEYFNFGLGLNFPIVKDHLLFLNANYKKGRHNWSNVFQVELGYKF